jgi:hypothetical protein
MAACDRPLVEALREFLGVGNLTESPARRSTWQPTVSFSISSLKRHHAATIPFADRFLLPCQKREQFEAWRTQLLEYEASHAIRRGRSTCSVEGCSGLVRGRGLCRRHYYRATGW